MNWTALVNSYLRQRRQLGYTLVSEGRLLLDFATFAERQEAATQLTVSLALQWANRAPSGSSIAIARRLATLRPFTRYLRTTGHSVVVLPTKLTGPTHRRLPPFIFNKCDIVHMMDAATSLVPEKGLRPITMRTLIGLLSSTGLRPGEAVRLQRSSVNLDKGELIIHHSKGWQRRIVPLSSSTVAALKKYASIRDHDERTIKSDAFFMSSNSRPLDIRAADYAFDVLRRKLGMSRKSNGRYPRLYDIRHTFVCHRVLAWYEAGDNVDSLITQLSMYLGHKHVSHTYWYITAIPSLMACAASRFATFLHNTGDTK